ncbi:cysteine-rich CWC family protein [Leptospira fainei]|uniref:cysteine-rich CWC family protein n=1 Tax=Leptospira fainei TaxID=48782 RepID=UPI0009FDDF5F
MTSKRCAKCSSFFDCRVDSGGCWCETLILNPEVLKDLRDLYSNCLCPICLREYESSQEAP